MTTRIRKPIKLLLKSASTEVRLNEIEAEKNAEIQAVQESALSKEKKEEKIRAIEKNMQWRNTKLRKRLLKLIRHCKL